AWRPGVVFTDDRWKPGVLPDLAELTGPYRPHGRGRDHQQGIDLAGLCQETCGIDDLLGLSVSHLVEEREHRVPEQCPNASLLVIERRQHAARPVQIDHAANSLPHAVHPSRFRRAKSSSRGPGLTRSM